jgi:hypothetical protein
MKSSISRLPLTRKVDDAERHIESGLAPGMVGLVAFDLGHVASFRL